MTFYYFFFAISPKGHADQGMKKRLRLDADRQSKGIKVNSKGECEKNLPQALGDFFSPQQPRDGLSLGNFPFPNPVHGGRNRHV